MNLITDSVMSYEDFINIYDRNKNQNNAEHLYQDLEDRLKYLRKLSETQRMMEIRNIERDIASFDENPVYRESFKKQSKIVSECEAVLADLHKQVAAQEKEMSNFYSTMTTTFDKGKVTARETDQIKRQNQTQGKAHQIKLDELLYLTLFQLKIYDNLNDEFKKEKKMMYKIRETVEQLKQFLKEAQFMKEKTVQNEPIIENLENMQRCMEIKEVKKTSIIVEIDTKLKKKPLKKIDKKYKSKFVSKPKTKDKKVIKQKPKPKKKVKKNKLNGKKNEINGKSPIKIEEENNDGKLHNPLADENKSEDKSIQPYDKDANVGCCTYKKRRERPIKNDHSDKISIKESIKSGKERNKSIKEDSIISNPNILEDDKNNKTKINVLQTESDVKKIRPNKPKSQSKTNSVKSQSPSSRSNTSKSRSKTPTQTSKTTKSYPKKSKSPHKKNNKKINEGKELKSDKGIHEAINQPEPENLDETIHPVESKEIEKKKDYSKRYTIDKKQKEVEYLTETEIMEKIKNNRLQYNTNFPKEYLKLQSSNINRENCKSNEESNVEEEDPQKKLERLKLERIQRLRLEEKDRNIIKRREVKQEELNEKERIKGRNKEFKDHKIYLKSLQKNKKHADINSKEITDENSDKNVIQTQPNMKYDYHTLLLESKNAESTTKRPNLYNPKKLNIQNKDQILIPEKKFSEDKRTNETNTEIKFDTNDLSEEDRHLSRDNAIESSKFNLSELSEEDKYLPRDNIIESSKEDNDGNESTIVLRSYDEVQKKQSEEYETKQVALVDKKEEEPIVKKEESIVEDEKSKEKEMVKEEDLANEKYEKEEFDTLDITEPDSKKVEVIEPRKEGGCFGKKPRVKKERSRDDTIEKTEEIKVRTFSDKKSSEATSVIELEPPLIQKQTTEEIIVDEVIESSKVESDSDDKDVSIPENEINNSKYWKQYIYHVELKALFERKIACIIRAKPGSIPRRKMITCKLILSSDEIPQLDQREDYTSYIFKIYPQSEEIASQISVETPWHIAIPYYLPEGSAKHPLIMLMNEDQTRWNECLTNDAIFDNLKHTGLKFVETKIQNPFGTYAVVSFLTKDKTIVNKEGTQLTSTSDRNVIFSVPPDAIRISINTALKVTSLDPIFWKEIKAKHEKSALDNIYLASPVVEIEAKKKKLTSPAILTLPMPSETVKVEIPVLKKKNTTESEDLNSKYEDDKNIKKILNPFQKTLLMPNVNSAQNIQDVHFLSYITEEERWSIIGNPKLNYDKLKQQINVELPALQSSKYILLKSKRKTTDECITKAAKIIDNELCVRNCVIALFQSTKVTRDFALTVSLKKYFQNHVNHLQNEGYVIDTANKSTYVELKERQILKIEFVGNITNIILDNNVSEFAFHSLFPNTQKFRVKEIDSFAQKAVSSYRGYVDLSTKSLVKKPLQSADGKVRKTNTQYTWVEENAMIAHLLISIRKKRIPKVSSFFNLKFNFKNFNRCVDIIKRISTKIGTEWWELGLLLNVSETRMHSIKLHNQDKGINKMAEQMLLYWLKGCETNENKYNLLTVALKTCGRSDIAERLHKPQERPLVFGC